MTSQDTEALKALVALAEKATPGPWKAGRESHHVTAIDKYGHTLYPASTNGIDNAKFIAAAMNAIPHLKALLGEQREAQPVAWVKHGGIPACTTDRLIAMAWETDEKNRVVPVYSVPPLAESVGDELNPKALEALKSYQQADRDGIMVNVSRQALDEAIAILERRHMQQGK